MSRVFAYLGRFAMIVLGFACAALAASVFFHLLALGGIGTSEEDSANLMGAALLVSVPVAALFIAYSAFLPAAVFFLLAELFSWRGWLPHALGGGAAAAAAVFWQGGTFGGPMTAGGRFELSLIACGAVGGIAYWLVAGRSSGEWLRGGEGREPTGPTPSGS